MILAIWTDYRNGIGHLHVDVEVKMSEKNMVGRWITNVICMFVVIADYLRDMLWNKAPTWELVYRVAMIS